MKKIKTLLTTVSLMSLFYLFYIVYYSSNKNDTTFRIVSIFCLITAATLGFLDGLDYIYKKNSKKIGYTICILTTIITLTFMFFIYKVTM
jgi:RsiW-degrading membrane proteinase PrsW (M82 family)